VKPGVPVNPIIAALGTLKPDMIPLADIAKNRRAASMLIDRTVFDN